MAENRTMQQKNLVNKKRCMRESLSRQYDIMSHEWRDYLDMDMAKESRPKWVGKRVNKPIDPLVTHKKYAQKVREKGIKPCKRTPYFGEDVCVLAGKLAI